MNSSATRFIKGSRGLHDFFLCKGSRDEGTLRAYFKLRHLAFVLLLTNKIFYARACFVRHHNLNEFLDGKLLDIPSPCIIRSLLE